MNRFLDAWLFVFVFSSPLIVCIFITMFVLRKYGVPIYRICWLNILLFLVYCFFLIGLVEVMYSGSDKVNKSLEYAFNIIFLSWSHLIIFLGWLYKFKPKKQSQTTEKPKALNDPILDERLPTK